LHRQLLVFLCVVNCPRRAGFFAQCASVSRREQAVLSVNHRNARDGLDKGPVDSRTVAQAGLKACVQDHFGAFLLTQPTARERFFYCRPRPLVDMNGKLSDKPRDLLDLAVGQECEVGMPTGIYHLGTEYSRATVEGGKGLVQLGHMLAEGWLPLYPVHFAARVDKERLSAFSDTLIDKPVRDCTTLGFT
jgi:hypothetical protein